MILHIGTRAALAAARADGHYRGDTLDTEGFIHCSDPGSVHLPANRLFAGRTDLVLFVIDPVRLDAPLRWEPGDPADPMGVWFPHVYGPLIIDAVVDVLDLVPEPDGSFRPVQLTRSGTVGTG